MMPKRTFTKDYKLADDQQVNARGAGVRKPALHEKAAALIVAAPTPLLIPLAKHPDKAAKPKEIQN